MLKENPQRSRVSRTPYICATQLMFLVRLSTAAVPQGEGIDWCISKLHNHSHRPSWMNDRRGRLLSSLMSFGLCGSSWTPSVKPTNAPDPRAPSLRSNAQNFPHFTRSHPSFSSWEWNFFHYSRLRKSSSENLTPLDPLKPKAPASHHIGQAKPGSRNSPSILRHSGKWRLEKYSPPLGVASRVAPTSIGMTRMIRASCWMLVPRISWSFGTTQPWKGCCMNKRSDWKTCQGCTWSFLKSFPSVIFFPVVFWTRWSESQHYAMFQLTVCVHSLPNSIAEDVTRWYPSRPTENSRRIRASIHVERREHGQPRLASVWCGRRSFFGGFNRHC